jgi:hypothetical protein
MTARFCPTCQQKHSNRRNCDGSKRTVDERIVGQRERQAAYFTERATSAAEALLHMGPNIRSVWWNKGGACQLCRQRVRRTDVVILPLSCIAAAAVHHSCALRLP